MRDYEKERVERIWQEDRITEEGTIAGVTTAREDITAPAASTAAHITAPVIIPIIIITAGTPMDLIMLLLQMSC